VTEPTENERREMNERLARAMGWRETTEADEFGPLFKYVGPNGTDYCQGWPDFTRDAEASRELVGWLAVQDRTIQGRFVRRLRDDTTDVDLCYELRILTASPLLIAMAADAATERSDNESSM